MLSAAILILVTLCMPFLQGLDINDWLWIGVMLNITVLRNEVSWRNCFNGLDKYIDLRNDFRYRIYSRYECSTVPVFFFYFDRNILLFSILWIFLGKIGNCKINDSF